MACMFLGYPLNHRGYRCLVLSTRKIVISCHVTFVKDVFPFSAVPAHKSLPSSPSPVPPIRVPPTNVPLATTPSPPAPQPSQNTHSMVIRRKTGISKPHVPLYLHTEIVSSLPLSHVQAAKDRYWNGAMHEEYDAHVKRGTWVMVPRPSNVNIIRSMLLF